MFTHVPIASMNNQYLDNSKHETFLTIVINELKEMINNEYPLSITDVKLRPMWELVDIHFKDIATATYIIRCVGVPVTLGRANLVRELDSDPIHIQLSYDSIISLYLHFIVIRSEKQSLSHLMKIVAEE